MPSNWACRFADSSAGTAATTIVSFAAPVSPPLAGCAALWPHAARARVAAAAIVVMVASRVAFRVCFGMVSS